MISLVGTGAAAGALPRFSAGHAAKAEAFARAMEAVRAGAGSREPATKAATAPEEPPAEDPTLKLKAAIEAFRKEAALTPAQRARRDVLKTMKLTEEAVKAMPPEQRKAIEEQIAAEVARRLRLDDGKVHTTPGNDPVAAES